MKQMKYALIFILTLATNIVKADTIDFWHVYYNDVQIKEFQNNELTLKIKDIKKTDSLTVMYFRDVHIIDCEAKVEIEDSFKFVIVKGVGIDRGTPLKISIFDLLVSARKSPFFAYYSDCLTENREKILLFKINFE